MKRSLLLFLLLFIPALLFAQSSGLSCRSVRLWPDGVPESNGFSGPETDMGEGRIGNVSDPELLVFPADNPNGLSVVMCPGGSYEYLAVQNEGTDMAAWFNSMGITFAVLKYRLPNEHCDIPLDDAHRAMTVMKSLADELGFNKIGIMGASAGGHLASCAAVHYTANTRPDFLVLLYPIISYMDRVSPGAKNVLFDMYPSDEAIEYYSSELNVTSDCPPTFIIHCDDDTVVPAHEIRSFYDALAANNVSTVLRTFPEGGHGWGFSDSFPHKDEWTSELEEWLLLQR